MTRTKPRNRLLYSAQWSKQHVIPRCFRSCQTRFEAAKLHLYHIENASSIYTALVTHHQPTIYFQHFEHNTVTKKSGDVTCLTNLTNVTAQWHMLHDRGQKLTPEPQKGPIRDDAPVLPCWQGDPLVRYINPRVLGVRVPPFYTVYRGNLAGGFIWWVLTSHVSTILVYLPCMCKRKGVQWVSSLQKEHLV